jgi:dihydropyrimidinase
MAYKGVFMLQDDEIFQVFEKCRQLGGIAMVHAENGSVITELEKEMSKLGITGPEGHLLSRPEKVKASNLYSINTSVCLSLKLKQQIVRLQLLNRLGKSLLFQ